MPQTTLPSPADGDRTRANQREALAGVLSLERRDQLAALLTDQGSRQRATRRKNVLFAGRESGARTWAILARRRDGCVRALRSPWPDGDSVPTSRTCVRQSNASGAPQSPLRRPSASRSQAWPAPPDAPPGPSAGPGRPHPQSPAPETERAVALPSEHPGSRRGPGRCRAEWRRRALGRACPRRRALFARCPSLPHHSPPGRSGAPPFSPFHALAGHDRGRGAGLLAGQLAGLLVESRVQAPQRAVTLPTHEVVVHGAARGQVLGQSAPLAACAQAVEHRIENLAQV